MPAITPGPQVHVAVPVALVYGQGPSPAVQVAGMNAVPMGSVAGQTIPVVVPVVVPVVAPVVVPVVVVVVVTPVVPVIPVMAPVVVPVVVVAVVVPLVVPVVVVPPWSRWCRRHQTGGGPRGRGSCGGACSRSPVSRL